MKYKTRLQILGIYDQELSSNLNFKFLNEIKSLKEFAIYKGQINYDLLFSIVEELTECSLLEGLALCYDNLLGYSLDKNEKFSFNMLKLAPRMKQFAFVINGSYNYSMSELFDTYLNFLLNCSQINYVNFDCRVNLKGTKALLFSQFITNSNSLKSLEFCLDYYCNQEIVTSIFQNKRLRSVNLFIDDIEQYYYEILDYIISNTELQELKLHPFKTDKNKISDLINLASSLNFRIFCEGRRNPRGTCNIDLIKEALYEEEGKGS